MSPTQPPRNKNSAARSMVTTRSAAKRQRAAASQRMEQLHGPGADGAEFQTTYNPPLETGPSRFNETMMNPPRGNGLGVGDFWSGVSDNMDKQRNTLSHENFMSYLQRDPWGKAEPLDEAEVQLLVGYMGADGGEDGAMPYNTETQTVLPIRYTSHTAAIWDWDPEDGPSPLPSPGSRHSAGDGLRLPFLEALMNPTSLYTSAPLLPKVAAPESSLGVSTVSKYTFQGQSINGHSYITAADFRAQVLNAPGPSKKAKYPFGFSDREGVAPELSHPLLHIPIIPGQKESFKDGVDDPDVLRAIYPKNRAKKGAVLARHDPEKGRTASGRGVMTRCNYHGARHRRRKQTEEDGA